MVHLLTAGHYRGVANLLRESRVVAGARLTDVTAEQRAMLGDASGTLERARRAHAAAPGAGRRADVAAGRTSWSSCSTSCGQPRLSTVFLLALADSEARVCVHCSRRRPGVSPARTRRSSCVSSRRRNAKSRRKPFDAPARSRRRPPCSRSARILGEPDVARRRHRGAGPDGDRVAGRAPGARAGHRRRRPRRPGHCRPRARRRSAYRPVLPRLEASSRERRARRGPHREDGVFRGVWRAVRRRRRSASRCLAQRQGVFRPARGPGGSRVRRDRAGTRRHAAKPSRSLRKAAAEKDIVVRNAVMRALRGGAAASAS